MFLKDHQVSRCIPDQEAYTVGGDLVFRTEMLHFDRCFATADQEMDEKESRDSLGILVLRPQPGHTICQPGFIDRAGGPDGSGKMHV
tara:strand:+ start:663 stop:923 length:261 start_codon:yes stop_codon:yes gene_type:complete